MQIDPQKELTAVAQLADIPCVFAVNAAHPAKTFAEFVAWEAGWTSPAPKKNANVNRIGREAWGNLRLVVAGA